MLVGILATSMAGIVAYKAYHSYRAMLAPKRFDAVSPVEPREGFKLFTASSLDRIFKDGKTLVKPLFSNVANISAARNEYESFQLVIQTQDASLRQVALDFSDLLDPTTGARIDKGNITWRVEGYVPTVKPYYPVKFVGEWPDPLLPLKDFDVPAQTTQPVWVTVYVPKETPAGRYRGTVWLRTEGKSPREIELDLRVFDFTLPKESSLKTAFDLYRHVTPSRYPHREHENEIAYQARMEDLNEQFTVMMLQYRMNPILNIDPTKPEELARVDRYRWFGLNNFSVGRKGGTFQNNWPEDEDQLESLEGLYCAYGEILTLNNLLDFTYLYTWDEGDIGNPKVPKVCSMVHRAHSGLKNMVCYHGFWDPQEMPEWGKDIDIWCFNVDEFVESKMRKLQEIGKEIWMYVSGPSGGTTPNLAMDFESMDYRIIPWLCWKYDIRGFLYWCVNWWEKVDPFSSAANTKWEQNANGLLFYPGQDGPVASLRAEVWRDGMEDYEYTQTLLANLWAFEKLAPETGYQGLIREIKLVLTMDESLIRSMSDYTRDQEVLLRRRNAIAEKIEETDQMLKKLLSPKQKILDTGPGQ